jgi:hypothetical protein
LTFGKEDAIDSLKAVWDSSFKKSSLLIPDNSEEAVNIISVCTPAVGTDDGCEVGMELG